MEFNEKRFLQLAGIHSKEAANSSEQRTEPTERRPLTESAKRAPAASSDEQKLRALIRREAQKMISEISQEKWGHMSLAAHQWWQENCSPEGLFSVTKALAS